MVNHTRCRRQTSIISNGHQCWSTYHIDVVYQPIIDGQNNTLQRSFKLHAEGFHELTWLLRRKQRSRPTVPAYSRVTHLWIVNMACFYVLYTTLIHLWSWPRMPMNLLHLLYRCITCFYLASRQQRLGRFRTQVIQPKQNARIFKAWRSRDWWPEPPPWNHRKQCLPLQLRQRG